MLTEGFERFFAFLKKSYTYIYAIFLKFMKTIQTLQYDKTHGIRYI